MALLEIVHGLSALLGLAAAVGLLGPWADARWEVTMAMWVGATGAIATGIVISLSYVGTGVQIFTPTLLAKVGVSVVLVGLMYTTLGGHSTDDLDGQRSRLIGISGVWVLLLVLGVLVAT